jgi:hypothetical protein
MIDIFLSASIPLPERDRHFSESANLLAIREAIKALVEVILPIGRITFGGHPAITPLIAFFVREAGLDRTRLTVFQSRYFENIFPEENAEFHDVRLVHAVENDKQKSLHLMRETMITSRHFRAAVLIGGMEGVLEEAELFRARRRDARILPIASTGAAALDFFRKGDFPAELQTELTYTTLFRRRLAEG